MDEKFTEIEHTADWSIRVSGSTLEELFKNASLGLYALAGVELSISPASDKTLALEAHDLESLLVAFLEEAIFALEVDNVGFQVPEIAINGKKLEAKLVNYEILDIQKEIKAVTFAGLKIMKLKDGYQVNIVFDA